MIQLVVDSTAAVPKDFLEQHDNVHVIPLFISVKGEYVPENEATIEQVIEYSESTKKAVPTSQPSTGDFLKLFESLPKEDPIIVICITSGVSGTYNGAVLAARQSGRKQITVINSRTTAVGMMEVLEDGLDMIDRGLSFEEISKGLQESASLMRTTFTVPTLDYLRRGGRVGKAAGLIGSILKIKPVIFLNDNNEVDVLAKCAPKRRPPPPCSIISTRIHPAVASALFILKMKKAAGRCRKGFRKNIRISRSLFLPVHLSWHLIWDRD